MQEPYTNEYDQKSLDKQIFIYFESEKKLRAQNMETHVKMKIQKLVSQHVREVRL